VLYCRPALNIPWIESDALLPRERCKLSSCAVLPARLPAGTLQDSVLERNEGMFFRDDVPQLVRAAICSLITPHFHINHMSHVHLGLMCGIVPALQHSEYASALRACVTQVRTPGQQQPYTVEATLLSKHSTGALAAVDCCRAAGHDPACAARCCARHGVATWSGYMHTASCTAT
jgi:hypothetical protein